MNCNKCSILRELFGTAIFTLIFVGLPALIYTWHREKSMEHVKYAKVFESPQSLADHLNDWYTNALENEQWFEIPNKTSRQLINQAYPLLNFTTTNGCLQIYAGYIFIKRSETTPKTEKTNGQK